MADRSFHDPATSKNQPSANELSDEQLDEVAGGLNPQPLPPRVWALRLPDDFYSVAVRSQIRF